MDCFVAKWAPRNDGIELGGQVTAIGPSQGEVERVPTVRMRIS